MPLERKQKRVKIRGKGSVGAALTLEAEAVLHRASASLLLPPDGTIVGQPLQVCPTITNSFLRESTEGLETIPRPGPRAPVQRRSVAIALGPLNQRSEGDVLLPVHRPCDNGPSLVEVAVVGARAHPTPPPVRSVMVVVVGAWAPPTPPPVRRGYVPPAVEAHPTRGKAYAVK